MRGAGGLPGNTEASVRGEEGPEGGVGSELRPDPQGTEAARHQHYRCAVPTTCPGRSARSKPSSE